MERRILPCMGKRWTGTAWLSIALALLVVLIAGLQWRWLGEIEEHEHYLRERRIGYAGWLYKTIVEREVERLMFWASPPSPRPVPTACGARSTSRTI